ncbi:MAG: methyltransferase domain-containing protein [Thermoleophilaceae bacterium]|nr:methyltransferase domain-containing protein [Thermoleophilaceae bacterium]
MRPKVSDRLTALVDQLDHLFRARPIGDARDVYDRVAPSYDAFRTLWLALVGGPAEEAMLDDLRAVLRPGSRVLDAGCGTGALARQVKAIEPDARLTLADASPEMLRRTHDVPGERLVANVLDLPFPDSHFDVVVSAWVIETVGNPVRAVAEYLRVIGEEGHVFYTFCSLPEGWLSQGGSKLLRSVIEHRFAGQFIPPERTPWHDCERSHRVRFQGGVTTEIALKKCCDIRSEPPS